MGNKKYRPAKRRNERPELRCKDDVKITKVPNGNVWKKREPSDRMQVRAKQYDYLKWWKVIRKWALVRYDITVNDLDMYLFLYSEDYFTRETFDRFNFMLSYDAERFEKMIYKGYIHVWREKTSTRKALYQMTNKAKVMINTIYQKLEGATFPETEEWNPILGKKQTSTNRVCASYIRDLNIERKRLQRLALESQENKSSQ